MNIIILYFSVFSNNYSKVISRYGGIFNAGKHAGSNDNWYSSMSEVTMCYIWVLHEIIEIRTGTTGKKCDNFSLEEVQLIMEDSCLK